MEEWSLAGVPFVSAPSLNRVVDELIKDALEGRGISVRLLNTYSLSLVRNTDYLHLLLEQGRNLPDGWPVVLGLKLTARRAKHRFELTQIRGPQLFTETLEAGLPRDLRHYFLGGAPVVLDALISRLKDAYPAINIAGASSPPYRDLTTTERVKQVEEIKFSGAQIVWVGLGTPKQDYVSSELARELGIPVVGVGAAFDFAAGSKREAGVWIRRLRVEWLYRLIQEPRRLWARYSIGTWRFLRLVLPQFARGGGAPEYGSGGPGRKG